MAKDPVRFGGGQANLYGYAGNEPVNRIDPTGLVDLFYIDTTDSAGQFASLFVGANVDPASTVNEFVNNVIAAAGGELIDNLYIISHGDPGQFHISNDVQQCSVPGDSWTCNMVTYTERRFAFAELERLAPFFAPNANAYLNSCQTACDSSYALGQDLIRELAILWGVTVYASFSDETSSFPGPEGPLLICSQFGFCFAQLHEAEACD